MSNYADPNKAYVWMDGDAFRGKAGAKLPTDPFAAKLADFDAFGGIEAGFEETADQSVDKKKVWNYRQAAYKVTRDPLESGIKFRAVDNSKATLLTRAQGGKITKLGANYGMERGLGEEFSLLVRLDDGEDKTAIFCERATLAGPPVRAALDGTNIDGWEFDVTFLAKPVEILPGLPDGIEHAEAPQQ